jgi:excisionase family DNA binding protein
MTLPRMPSRHVQPMERTVNPLINKLTLSADEVAALLGVSRAKVYEAIHVGELPSIRLGRRVLVPARAIYELVGEPPPFVSTTGTCAEDETAEPSQLVLVDPSTTASSKMRPSTFAASLSASGRKCE